MTRNAPARFQWRAFVALGLTLGFLALAVSGIVLYVAPPGRVANWARWTLGALDRHQWQALHTAFALVFLVAGAFHLWFNVRALVFYVRSRIAEGARLRRELVAAGAAAAAVATLTLADLPPFSSVLDAGEAARSSWSSAGGEPPVPHAELLTLERLAATTQGPARPHARQSRGRRHRGRLGGLDDRRPGVRPPAPAERGLDAAQGRREAQGDPGGRRVREQDRERGVRAARHPRRRGPRAASRRGIEAGGDSPMKVLAERHGKRPHDLVEILAGA
jgi:hypothetical protein